MKRFPSLYQVERSILEVKERKKNHTEKETDSLPSVNVQPAKREKKFASIHARNERL